VRALCIFAVLLIPLRASASLTDSEKAEIKGFVQQAQLPTAERVRVLVARPDLSLDEATRALAAAVVPLSFRESTASYLRELVFGGASISGRAVLVSALARALLARADAILAKYATDVDQHPEALAELSRVYAFLDAELANAGGAGRSRDSRIGILPSTYDDCVRALAEHVQRNARWLVPQAPVSLAFQRVRAQEEVAIYDMTNDSPMRRVDAAAALGLRGERKRLLTELGVLVLDGGAADDAILNRVRALLLRLPAAMARPAEALDESRGASPTLPSDIETIEFGDAHPLLRARGKVIGVAVPLELTASKMGPVATSEDVDTAPLNLPLFVLAYELAKPTTARVLADRPDLKRWVERDVQAAEAPLGAMTTEERVAGMMAQLLVDAPRTIDMAFVRFLGGRTRTAGLLSDALGVLAAISPARSLGGSTAVGRTVTLGRPVGSASNGETERVDASALQLAPTGAATSFFLAHRWDIQRDPGGSVDSVHCDGQPVTLAVLRSARVPLTGGSVWTAGGLVFARLAGTPRAGVAVGSRVRLAGVGESGADAIATPAPGDDVVIDADLSVSGGEGGIVARTVSTRGSFQGVSLMLVPSLRQSGGVAYASLRLDDAKGEESNLGAPVEIPSPRAHVKLTVKGANVFASVGSVVLAGSLPPALAHGDVALRANAGATVEASGLSIRPTP
jgi:hypothetical protein